ncbi:MAG: spermidine/putrescine ABC transporter substrate-binding protein [Verrucomicrobia bacterium]|nr:spermidine/putrescine ABC transporter substrate-binding protein [Verrucomicrobiota bacterium]
MKTLRSLTLLALPFLLAACGGGSQPAASSAGASNEEKKLNIFCWAEYIPQGVIDEFSKETGIQVSVENYASNEELIGKLVAGGGKYDLIQPSEYAIEALVKADQLQPLNQQALTNLGNLAPEFRGMPFDPGNKYSVPFMAGFVGICVNTDKIKTPVTGFADVFTPANKGRIVILDDAREISSWALGQAGLGINDVNPETLAKIKPILEKWLPLVKVYDSDSPKTALKNGDVDIGVFWSGEAAILYNDNKKFGFVLPKEGAHLFVDNMAIPKTATHPQNAHLFINYLLRPEVSKKISDAFPYYNPNSAARSLLSADQLANPASYPPAQEVSRMQTFRDLGEQAAAIDELVTKVKAGGKGK